MSYKYTDFVNDHTINIFTDASILQVKYNGIIDHYVGTPGFVVYLGNQIIDQYSEIRAKTTNNFCEIYAIRLAVEYAAMMQQNNPITFNIFSDSKISIYGIREWIYKWIESSSNGTLFSTSGPVKNQEQFLAIVYLILSKNLRINFYHVRGHHDHGTQKELFSFRDSFMRENHIPERIEDTLVSYLIRGNSAVDNLTRNYLLNKEAVDIAYKIADLYEKQYINVQYGMMIPELDMNKYKNLIGGNNNAKAKY